MRDRSRPQLKRFSPTPNLNVRQSLIASFLSPLSRPVLTCRHSELRIHVTATTGTAIITQFH